ncbi:cytochrome B [Methanolobus sp. ZRKC3]|uniref:cytochrome B n=1 Tax=Methanolobus sp. ZRKC3 TaxID=3125786 RepID=UPI0032469FC7
MEQKDSMIVKRYSFLERLAHFVHLFTLFILLITGFKIYGGWDFMSYHIALVIHLSAAFVFVFVNWVIIPYNVMTSECPRCPMCAAGVHNLFLHRMNHIAHRYLFGPTDVRRMKQIFLNYLGKGEYPAFTVYDVKNEGYIDKLHPVTQFMLFFEGGAVMFVVFTGIVLYNLQWTLLGLPISEWLISGAELISDPLDMHVLAFIRTAHLMMAYFFIVELIIHVGIVELDPKVWKYHKAIFLTGKEDLSDSDYVELLGAENNLEG